VGKSGFQFKGTKKAADPSMKSNPEQNSEESGTNLDFQIENSGSNLSNGEKQIINFLRILIRNNDIICLDEATSNMDPKTG
jgi:ABC-type multidrug transport system fused ATPase/permease subunit